MCDAIRCDDCNSISYTLHKVSDGWYVCKKCKEKREDEESNIEELDMMGYISDMESFE